MKNLTLAAIAFIAAAASGTPAFAQDATDYSDVVVTTTPLRGGVYMLQGEGGNVAVAVGDEGIVVIDSMFEPLYNRIKAAIAEISDKPVRYLINTHHHRDHTGGNARFAEDGAQIIAQENMVPLIAEGSVNGLTGNRLPPAPPAAIPSLVYSDEMTVEMPGLRAELKYPGNAHTNADTYIYFPEENILVTGDIVTLGRYPNIDFAYGGHIQKMIDVTDQFIAMADDDTIIVPGHGPVGNKQDLIDYREMLATSRDRISDLMINGQTLNQMIAARPNADYDAAMNVEERRIENWIRVIYYSYNPPE